MAQPEYVPNALADQVREPERLPPSIAWRSDRPADLHGFARAAGPRLGHPAPDLGYGLKLARRFHGKLQLSEAITEDDAVAGCFPVAAKRAGIFGRAPIIYDLELAFTLWGFLGGAPVTLVEARKPLFASCSHAYWDQRDITDAVPESTLRLAPAQVRGRLADWKSMLSLGAAAH